MGHGKRCKPRHILKVQPIGSPGSLGAGYERKGRVSENSKDFGLHSSMEGVATTSLQKALEVAWFGAQVEPSS